MIGLHQKGVTGAMEVHVDSPRCVDDSLRPPVPGQPLHDVVGPPLVTVGHRLGAGAVEAADGRGPGVETSLGSLAQGPGPPVICLYGPV